MYKKAGEIGRKSLEYGASLIREGARAIDVAKAVENKILELGGKFAFPVNISINEVAAHYTPKEDDPTTFTRGDVVKLDIGAHVNGYISDTAITVDIGNQHKDLKRASEEALKAAIEVVKPGIEVWKIGKVVEETIKSYGFIPISNLTGHSITRYNLHSGKTIPNINNGMKTKLEEDDVIAIEPFATNGGGYVIDSSMSEIYSLIRVAPVRNQLERKIIQYIQEEFHELPFCKRWIIKKFPQFGTNFALRSLVKQEILHQYPTLKEGMDGIVSQREKTMIVRDPPIVTT